MGVLLDTSVLIAVERDGADLHAFLATAGSESLAIAALTASELLHGLHRADSALRRARREEFIEWVFATVPVVAMDLAVARVHARIWADLQARGQLIGAHDAIIAATALSRGDAILTRNERDFGRVEGLRVLTPKA